jgi:hypothetical protein
LIDAQKHWLDLDSVEELYVKDNFEILKSAPNLKLLHLTITDIRGLNIEFVARLTPKAMVMEIEMFDYSKMNGNEHTFDPLKAIIPGLQDLKVKLQQVGLRGHTPEESVTAHL